MDDVLVPLQSVALAVFALVIGVVVVVLWRRLGFWLPTAALKVACPDGELPHQGTIVEEVFDGEAMVCAWLLQLVLEEIRGFTDVRSRLPPLLVGTGDGSTSLLLIFFFFLLEGWDVPSLAYSSRFPFPLPDPQMALTASAPVA